MQEIREMGMKKTEQIGVFTLPAEKAEPRKFPAWTLIAGGVALIAAVAGLVVLLAKR